ncbi:hypothetical protein AURDEDRAFT_176801 [Auricularia subglabra TFB-10046 SS5]|uniref:SUN domain-containing protein n=1 Tax=Auricularia subglabra (strain TFB-10046 / SS5) TaxID=717982 RepID=J0CUV6_AURST|nr:hypothetical protein AURDEDRAFT_176801 [Auricularia subglabra TFB-10046 SS5]
MALRQALAESPAHTSLGVTPSSSPKADVPVTADYPAFMSLAPTTLPSRTVLASSKCPYYPTLADRRDPTRTVFLPAALFRARVICHTRVLLSLCEEEPLVVVMIDLYLFVAGVFSLYLALHIARDYYPIFKRMRKISNLFAALALMALVAYALGTGRQPRTLAWSLDDSMFHNGARIVDAWTSPTYTPPANELYATTIQHPDLDRLVRQSQGPVSIPEVALGLYPDCRSLWFFAGQRALLTVALPEPAHIDHLRLRGHSDRHCLPRDVNVWGLVDSASITHNVSPAMFDWPPTGFPAELRGSTKLRAPEFIADLGGLLGQYPSWIPLAQLRDIPRGDRDSDFAVHDIVSKHGIAVHAVALEFRRNWGSKYSCFAELGISGTVG